MKKCYYGLSILLLFSFGSQSWGQEEPVQVEVEGVRIETALTSLNQTEEVITVDEVRPERKWYGNEEGKALWIESQERIQEVVAEIDNLIDRNDEAELQKRIGQIKHDYEIARLRLALDKAEKNDDTSLMTALSDEIIHLENIDEPVIGTENEQAAPQNHKPGN